MIMAKIFEAKTNLSELLRKAQEGETVIITSGRDKIPVARLEAIHPVGKKRLGVLDVESALRAGRRTAEHRDPFDRMIAARALAGGIPILSTDSRLDAFGVRRIWAD